MTPDPQSPAPAGRIVLLAGPGDATAIVYHYLAERFDDVVAVIERARVASSPWPAGRARRLGWPTVAGQVAFVTLAMPVLRRRGGAGCSRSWPRPPSTPAPSPGRTPSPR